MTKIILSLSPFIFFSNPFWAQTVVADSLPITKVVWDATFHNFGKVKAGVEIEHAYRFTNAGSAPLLISFVIAACGCTVPEWRKDTIPRGGTGEIKVKFNTAKKTGRQLRTIRVIANTDPSETILQLGGTVKVSKRNKKHKG